MNIYIVCVGKIKEKYINDGIAEFEKRMKSFVKVNIIELKEYSKEDTMDLSIKKETAEILKCLSKINAYKIALDLGGQNFTSIAMADKITELANKAIHDVCFIIGGSNGYEENLLKEVDMRLKFSDFTFPHQLMRLILMEQIYRWFSIINNIKYHK